MRHRKDDGIVGQRHREHPAVAGRERGQLVVRHGHGRVRGLPEEDRVHHTARRQVGRVAAAGLDVVGLRERRVRQKVSVRLEHAHPVRPEDRPQRSEINNVTFFRDDFNWVFLFLFCCDFRRGNRKRGRGRRR